MSSIWSCSNPCSHYSLLWTSFSLPQRFLVFQPISVWSTTCRCVQWLLEINRRVMFPSDELTYLLNLTFSNDILMNLAFSNDIFHLTRTWIIICVLQFRCGGGCWHDSRAACMSVLISVRCLSQVACVSFVACSCSTRKALAVRSLQRNYFCFFIFSLFPLYLVTLLQYSYTYSKFWVRSYPEQSSMVVHAKKTIIKRHMKLSLNSCLGLPQRWKLVK